MNAQFVFGVVVGFTVLVALLILRQPNNGGVPGIPVYLPTAAPPNDTGGWVAILLFVLVVVMAFVYFEIP